jgi:DnaJ-domain-containing protein 1
MGYNIIFFFILLFLGGVLYCVYKIISLVFKFIFGKPVSSSNFSEDDRRVIVHTYVAMAKLIPNYGVDKTLTSMVCDYSKSAFKNIAFADNCYAPIKKMMTEFMGMPNVNESYLQRELTSFRTKDFPFKKEFMMGLFSIAYLNGEFEGNRESLINIIRDSIGMSDSEYNKTRMFWSRMMLGKIANLQDLERRRAEWYERDTKKKSEQFNQEDEQDYRYSGEEYEDYKDKTSYDFHISAELAKAYSILELLPNATVDEIKSKKRELLKKYHPDLYTSLGEQAVEDATKKSQEINQTFEMIMRMKN